MKMLVCIANYGEHQVSFLRQVIDEFRGMNFTKDIVVDSTIPLQLRDVTVRLHPSTIREKLPFAHRALMTGEMGNYDLYAYVENDILITEQNVRNWLSTTEQLPHKYITGFIRYEVREGRKLLIDAHPDFEVQAFPLHMINKSHYFCLANLHSGCYLLTQEQLKHAIQSGGFNVRAHRRPYGMLEQGASDVYTQCGFRHKVLPGDFTGCLVHHLSNKYVMMGGRWDDPGIHTVETLSRLVHSTSLAQEQVTLPVLRKQFWIGRQCRKLMRSVKKRLPLKGTAQ